MGFSERVVFVGRQRGSGTPFLHVPPEKKKQPWRHRFRYHGGPKGAGSGSQERPQSSCLFRGPLILLLRAAPPHFTSPLSWEASGEDRTERLTSKTTVVLPDVLQKRRPGRKQKAAAPKTPVFCCRFWGPNKLFQRCWGEAAPAGRDDPAAATRAARAKSTSLRLPALEFGAENRGAAFGAS